MIFLTAGHTGEGTGAQGVYITPDERFDEGEHTIWLRNRIAGILAEKYLHAVLIDADTTSLSVLMSQVNHAGDEQDILIDIHFNAHPNEDARGSETIVSDRPDATELRMASALAHTAALVLEIPLRSIKAESETPHHRLGILHVRPHAVILEVCFATSPDDVEAYMSYREPLAHALAEKIHRLIIENHTHITKNEHLSPKHAPLPSR